MQHMRLFITVTVLLCLSTGFVHSDALDFFTPPVVTVPLIEDAPKLDGFVRPEEWANAATLPRLISVGGTSKASAKTDIWVAYDVHCLYIGAICHHPAPDQIKMEITTEDGPVYDDDSLSLLLDPANEGNEYIHLALNPEGIRYDALGTDASVDYRWQTRAAVLESGWSAEFSLPFAQDVPPSPGVAWGFLIGRHVPHMEEYSASSRVMKDFHEAANFGHMVFSGDAVSGTMAFLGEEQLGTNQAAMVVQNLGEQVFAGKANVRVMSPTHYGHYYGAVKFSVDPGQKSIVEIPYEIRQDGLNTVQFSVTDAEGETVLRTAPYPIPLPAVEQAFIDLEDILAESLRSWSVLDSSEYKQQAETELDRLLGQWRVLRESYRTNRKDMPACDLEAMRSEVLQVTERARALKRELNAAVQTQSAKATDIRAADAMSPVSVDMPFDDFYAADLSCAAGHSTALQMVIPPFRAPGRSA